MEGKAVINNNDDIIHSALKPMKVSDGNISRMPVTQQAGNSFLTPAPKGPPFLWRLSLRKYSPKVSANYLVLVATPPTCKVGSTKYTHVSYVAYTEESENSDGESDAENSVSTSSSDGLAGSIQNAVATISTEIMALDKIGFDEDIDVEETDDT